MHFMVDWTAVLLDFMELWLWKLTTVHSHLKVLGQFCCRLWKRGVQRMDKHLWHFLFSTMFKATPSTLPSTQSLLLALNLSEVAVMDVTRLTNRVVQTRSLIRNVDGDAPGVTESQLTCTPSWLGIDSHSLAREETGCDGEWRDRSVSTWGPWTAVVSERARKHWSAAPCRWRLFSDTC